MRISDGRYDRDRARLSLALRMIRLGARTQTVRLATWLSKERIRRLAREYASLEGDWAVPRLRGKSPRRMSHFRQTYEHEQQAATFGCLLLECELAGPAGSREAMTSEEAERFCDVFEMFRYVCPMGLISFEHAWYLRDELATRRQYALAACQGCRALWIRDTLDLLPDRCPACRTGLYEA
ncbi:MAG TPA: hypothetical protein VMT50_01805 [Steroidobacteraceae bacterium]|nr:hypothetical protein [Steroidobacteraceae bacterium]